jgi:hypothetical protein
MYSYDRRASSHTAAAKPRFQDVQKMLLDGLKEKGWDVKTGLSVPHASTDKYGGTRLWFKTQSVYLNDLDSDPRAFKNTHSLSSDIREYKTVGDLIEDVERMRKIQAE